jgi:hypothetical protein
MAWRSPQRPSHPTYYSLVPHSITECAAATQYKPAGDVAAQAAAALALLSAFFRNSSGSTADDKSVLAPKLAAKATRAYAYALAMYEANEGKTAYSSCSRSGAKANCVGACVTASQARVVLLALASMHAPAWQSLHGVIGVVSALHCVTRNLPVTRVW